MFNKGRNNFGFTLIELLVVISIIGLLSAVVLQSLNSARGKASDAARKATIRNIRSALFMFYDKNGRMPNNYYVGAATCDQNNDSDVVAKAAAYNTSMTELVTAGFLPSVPKSPNASGAYCYYNYGPGNDQGAMFVTIMESEPPSLAYPGTCRPAPAGSLNWCTQDLNNWYCSCNPY